MLTDRLQHVVVVVQVSVRDDDSATGGEFAAVSELERLAVDFWTGGGNDTVTTGNADDVLIAGTTNYDNDVLALNALLSEWSSNTAYATRVNNLRNGLGLTGGRKLNGDDGATQTVFNDNDVDVLSGNSDLDAFWANTVADNGGAIDCVNSARNESVFDTDF